MELSQLEQLVTVAACKTLSGAAEVLHISQPALTRSMQKLEEDLKVTLFDRQKNRIVLNENGKLAVDYASRVLNQVQDMVMRVRAFDRSQKTLLLGFCAPVPQQELVSMASSLYPEMTIASELRGLSELTEGLQNGTYQAVVLPYPIETEDLVCVKYKTEKLYFSLPPAHPLAKYKSVRFKDIDGENMLLFSQIGFWKEVCKEQMPHSHFLIQEDRYTFLEIVRSSALPCFASDLMMQQMGKPQNRIVIPIVDEAAQATYYFICKKNESKKLAQYVQRIQASAE